MSQTIARINLDPSASDNITNTASVPTTTSTDQTPISMSAFDDLRQPTSGSLPDWATNASGKSDENTTSAFDDLLNPPKDDAKDNSKKDGAIVNAAKGVAAGGYAGLSDIANLPATAINTGLNVLHGLGGAETKDEMNNTVGGKPAADQTQAVPTGFQDNGPNRMMTVDPNPEGYEPQNIVSTGLMDAARGGVGVLGGGAVGAGMKGAGALVGAAGDGIPMASRLARGMAKVGQSAIDAPINPLTASGATNLVGNAATGVTAPAAVSALPDDASDTTKFLTGMGAGALTGASVGAVEGGAKNITSRLANRRKQDISYGDGQSYSASPNQAAAYTNEIAPLIGGKDNLPAASAQIDAVSAPTPVPLELQNELQKNATKMSPKDYLQNGTNLGLMGAGIITEDGQIYNLSNDAYPNGHNQFLNAWTGRDTQNGTEPYATLHSFLDAPKDANEENGLSSSVSNQDRPLTDAQQKTVNTLNTLSKRMPNGDFNFNEFSKPINPTTNASATNTIPGYEPTLPTQLSVLNGQQTQIGEQTVPVGLSDNSRMVSRLQRNNNAMSADVKAGGGTGDPEDLLQHTEQTQEANTAINNANIADTTQAQKDAGAPLAPRGTAGDDAVTRGTDITSAINNALAGHLAPIKQRLDNVQQAGQNYAVGSQRPQAAVQSLLDATGNEGGEGTGATIDSNLQPIINSISKWGPTVPYPTVIETLSNLGAKGRVIASTTGDAKQLANVQTIRQSLLDSISNSEKDVAATAQPPTPPDLSDPTVLNAQKDYHVAVIRARVAGQADPPMPAILQPTPPPPMPTPIPAALVAKNANDLRQYGQVMTDAETGPMSTLLTRNGNNNPPSPEEVTQRVLGTGSSNNGRAARVNSLMDFTSNDPNVKTALEDGLIADMKKSNIIDQNGIITNQDALNKYMTQPETDNMLSTHMPELKAQLTNAGTAQQAVNDAAAAKVASDRALGKSALAQFLPNAKAPPETVIQSMLRQPGMKKLAVLGQTVEGHPTAQPALTRMVTDGILKEVSNPDIVTKDGVTGATTTIPGGMNLTKLRSMVTDPVNRRALISVGGGAWMNNLDRVASQAQKEAAGKVPDALGGSATVARQVARDKYNISKTNDADHTRVMDLLISHGMESASDAVVKHGVVGAITSAPHIIAGAGPVIGWGVAKGIVNRFRQAGINDATALRNEAYYNPKLASQLFKIVPNNTDISPMIADGIRNSLSSAIPGQVPGNLARATQPSNIQ